MTIYVLLEAIAGIIAAVVIARRTKKAEGIVYSRLDRAGRITNIVLSILYVITSPIYLLIGILSEPGAEGILWPLGLIVSLIAASAAMFCALGIGFSVALRKKGESRKSFVVQFAGIAAILLTILLYGVFAGSLITSLN